MKPSSRTHLKELLSDLDQLESKIDKVESALRKPLAKSRGDGNEKFVRQGLLARLVHFSHLAFTLVLAFTGLVILFPGVFPWVSRGALRATHLWVSLFLVAIPLGGAVLAPRATLELLSEYPSWTLKDLIWLVKFPFRLFQPNRKIEVPVIKTKLNPGQKLMGGSLLTLLTLLAASGTLRLFPDTIPPSVIARSETVHRVAFPILLFFLSGHLAIGSGVFEIYRGVWRVMFGDGTVTRRLAEEHWPNWLHRNEAGEWPSPITAAVALRAAGMILWLAAVTVAFLFVGT